MRGDVVGEHRVGVIFPPKQGTLAKAPRRKGREQGKSRRVLAEDSVGSVRVVDEGDGSIAVDSER